MKVRLNKILTITIVTISLIVYSIFPVFAENNNETNEYLVPNNSVKIEVDNKTIDSIEIIIHGLFLATIAYLIIRFDKRRYHK